MSAKETPNEPFFRGLLLQPFNSNGRTVYINNMNAPDGQCELAIRKAEMPPIDELAEEMRFTVGIATRYIAASLDAVLHLSVAQALTMYGELAEGIGDWMDQHHDNVSTFDVDALLGIYLRRFGHLYDATGFVAPLFASRVHNYVNIFIPPLLHGQIAEENHKGSLGALFAGRNPGAKNIYLPPRAYDIEAACADLFEKAHVLRVPAHVYDECERADWTGFYLNSNVFQIRAFRVQVDGQTWLQSISNPLIQLQTEWLIIDIRDQVWKCYERVLSRKLDSGERGEITYGAWTDSKTGEYGPIETQMYVPINNEYQSLTCPPEEASRIFHVMASLMLLMQHPKVKLKMSINGRRSKLILPKGRSVNSLIADLIGLAK